MEITEKVYDKLPPDAVSLRTEIFVEEQGFEEEFDAIDETARHIVFYRAEEPVAVCRFFYDEERKSYILGRIAVKKELRGKGTGAHVIKTAERIIKETGGKIVSLHAQERASAFYEKQGYLLTEERGYEEFCPHVWMYKELKN